VGTNTAAVAPTTAADAAMADASAPPLRLLPKNATSQTDDEKAECKRIKEFLDHVLAGDIAYVQAELDAGFDPNVGDDNSITAVHMAMRANRSFDESGKSNDEDVKILQLLMSKGAYVEFADAYGNRPIVDGLQFNRQRTVGTLLGLEPAPYNKLCIDLLTLNEKTQNNLLHDAAWWGHVEMVRLLLATGQFSKEIINAYNKSGKGAVHIAAFRGSKDFVHELVQAGGDANLVEKNVRRISKETPEMMAVSMGREDTAQYLRELSTAIYAVGFGSKMMKGAKKNAAAAADAAD